MDEIKHLHALLRYLRPLGRARVSSFDTAQLSQRKYVLQFTTDGALAFDGPTTGSADINISWDESAGLWECNGVLFGETFTGDDPKAAFHSVARSVKNREQSLKGFLQQAMFYWERYAGDLEQFQYRLGIQMAASWHTTREDASYCFAHSLVKDLRICFSADTSPVDFGMLPRARYGFLPAVQTHKTQLSVDNLALSRDTLAKFSHESREFCEGASACFGLTDYSDVPD